MKVSGGLLTIFVAMIFSTAVEPIPVDERSECPLVPSYVFYSVLGDTAEEVLASLRRDGPKDERGNARFAMADWDVAWQWKLDAHGGVDVPTVKVACNRVITLPRLIVSPKTPRDLVQAWNSFVERLRDHELGHLQHASNRAPEIARRLAEARYKSRYLSPHRANAIARRIIREIQGLDRAYDARTNHGKTEGNWEIL